MNKVSPSNAGPRLHPDSVPRNGSPSRSGGRCQCSRAWALLQQITLLIVCAAGGLTALPASAATSSAVTGHNAVRGPAKGTPESDAPSPQTKENPVPLHEETAFYGAMLKHGIPISGTAKRVIVRRQDGRWEYRFDVDSFFADIHEKVIFRYSGDQIIPLHYHYQLTGWAVPDRSAQLDFNWQKMRVRNLVKDKPWLMKIHPGVLDRLGSQLQLRQDVKAGKKKMLYYVADGGELKDYRFAVVGPETLDTRKLGVVDTIKVREVRAPGKQRRTELWFAPKWDYLLVKLLQVEPDGTEYEIFLDHARIPGKRIGDWSQPESNPMPGKH